MTDQQLLYLLGLRLERFLWKLKQDLGLGLLLLTKKLLKQKTVGQGLQILNEKLLPYQKQ
jgi:hypothetical protein